MHVPAGADGADPMAATALGPADVVAVAELAAHERRLFFAEAEAAALAGLTDDGEVSCRAEEDDRLLVQLQAAVTPWLRYRRRNQGNARGQGTRVFCARRKLSFRDTRYRVHG